MRALKHALFAFALLMGVTAFAQSTISVDASVQTQTAVSLTEYLGILEDTGGSLGFRDVQQEPVASRFQNGFAAAEELNFGYTDSAYWVRVHLKNPSDQALERVLELAFARITEVEFYQPRPDGGVATFAAGMGKPFASRPYLHHNFPFFLTLPPRSEQVVFFRLKNAYRMVIPIRLWDVPGFRAYERQDYVVHAMYFGLAFGMVIFNVLLFLSLRDTTYLRYVLAVLCLMGAVAAKNGLMKEFLWQEAPLWSDRATFTFYLLSYAATANFMRHMLQLGQLAPRLDRLIQGMSVAYLLAPIGLFIAFAPYANFIAKVNFFGTVLLVGTIAYCAWRRQRTAYFLLAASLALVLGSLLTVLKAPGLIPTGVLTLHGLQIGSAMEMLLLALALADRFNLERLARVRAQEALVEGLQRSERELEAKVVQRTSDLVAEQEKSRQLLTNILPEPVIAELTSTGKVEPAEHRSATILFTDLAGFTQATATMPADRMVGELNDIFAAFDDLCREEGVEKIKTIGDAYMAVSGISTAQPDHAERCARVALRMQAFMTQRNEDAAFKWNLRVGLHSGPVVSGVVGKHKYAFDIWGDAVNIASRMESSGEVGRVNISAYTYDLIRKAFDCTYRGKIAAKGKGEVDMYFVDRMKVSS